MPSTRLVGGPHVDGLRPHEEGHTRTSQEAGGFGAGFNADRSGSEHALQLVPRAQYLVALSNAERSAPLIPDV